MNPLDYHVYIWKNNNKVKLLSFYVDDILLASNYLDMINKTKEFLESKFEINNMGETTYVLGIRIQRD